MIEPIEVERKIRSAIDCFHVEVEDLTGTKNHFRAIVVSSAFEDQLPVARHRLVYAALHDEMKGTIHALSLETLTPTEWEARKG